MKINPVIYLLFVFLLGCSDNVSKKAVSTPQVAGKSWEDDYEEFFDTTNSPSTRTTKLSSNVNLEMIWVEPGTFTMGSPTTEVEQRFVERETQREVTLTNGFYLGKHEVTQAQYEAVMTGVSADLNATPSYWHGCPNRPVERVSWKDIQVFFTRLNEKQADNIPVGWAYALPSEAQWEYACRAGTTTAYSFGNSITGNDANYNKNIGQTTDVGKYRPNPWGFFDMHGNVWEWTADWYSIYSSVAVTNPEGPATGSVGAWSQVAAVRVFRGGSWDLPDSYLRSAIRYGPYPWTRKNNLGFRVAFLQVSKRAKGV